MKNHIRPALVFIVTMTVLTGFIYPLGMTALAQMLFPAEANGSLILRDGKVIGSSLIGQNFTGDKYFHGRPSATSAPGPNDATKTVSAPYNAANSSGSNLGPTSQSLIDRIKADTVALQKENSKPVPVDLITTSGSGLDPHISPAAADFQIPRLAKSRNMTESALRELVNNHIEGRALGFLGEPVINVLNLNLALDELTK